MKLRSFLVGVVIGLLLGAKAYAGEWKCVPNAAGQKVLTFRGGVDLGEYQRYRAEFSRCYPGDYRGQRVVDLFSGGGFVHEALRISRDIASESRGPRAVATRIQRGSYCISACTFIFVSGRLRDVDTGGSFEPHGFSSYLGTRIDVAILEADVDPDEKTADITMARLLLLAEWFPKLAEDDPRFKWAASWAEPYFRDLRRSGKDKRVAHDGFAQLNEAQRKFIARMDSVIASVLPELERVSALQEFEQLLANSNTPLIRAAPIIDEKSYLNWIATVAKSAGGDYLSSLKEIRPMVIGEAFLNQILASLREQSADTRKSVRNPDGLGHYLISRSDEIDVAGLVTLMFSTSILYTRPVSREEMCDLNIVNRDCMN